MAKSQPLIALSLCYEYSDYLSAVATRNRGELDRWIVVTSADDRRTHSVCRSNSIDYVVFENSGSLNVVTAKSEWINYGLTHIAPEAWVLILDVDILLPYHFRRRIRSIVLEPDCLYGMAGRKLCVDPELFYLESIREPWAPDLVTSEEILGYFQLFFYSDSEIHYPSSDDHRELSDDVAFAKTYETKNHRHLPMTCLHLGPVEEDWYGRKSSEFRIPDRATTICGLLDSCLGNNKAVTRCLYVGYQNPAAVVDLAQYVAQLDLIQDSETVGESEVLFQPPIEELSHSCRISVRSASSLSSQEAYELLYFERGMDIGSLVRNIWRYYHHLEDGGFIVGHGYFENSDNPQSNAITLLFGPPTNIGYGMWLVRKNEDSPAQKWCNAALSDHAVVYTISAINGVVLEHLIISLFSLRKYWLGEVLVLLTTRGSDATSEEERNSVRAICSAFGVKAVMSDRDLEVLSGFVMLKTVIQPAITFLWKASPFPMNQPRSMEKSVFFLTERVETNNYLISDPSSIFFGARAQFLGDTAIRKLGIDVRSGEGDRNYLLVNDELRKGFFNCAPKCRMDETITLVIHATPDLISDAADTALAYKSTNQIPIIIMIETETQEQMPRDFPWTQHGAEWHTVSTGGSAKRWTAMKKLQTIARTEWLLHITPGVVPCPSSSIQCTRNGPNIDLVTTRSKGTILMKPLEHHLYSCRLISSEEDDPPVIRSIDESYVAQRRSLIDRLIRLHKLERVPYWSVAGVISSLTGRRAEVAQQQTGVWKKT